MMPPFSPQFPWLLDMEPYTAEGISKREKECGPADQQQYELVGIMVHSGQASAGHYYVFIKEKRYILLYGSLIFVFFS